MASKSPHLHGLETFAPRPVNDTQLLQLSTLLGREGAHDQAIDVAQTAYDRGTKHGDRFLAGQAASIASFYAARGDYEHDVSLSFGEQSRDALPLGQPVGDRLPELTAAVSNRFRAAARVMLQGGIPVRSEATIRERATRILGEDVSVNADFKRAIIYGLTGQSGARDGLAHVRQGLQEAWSHMPDDSAFALVRYAGRETLASAVTLGLLAPQSLGRVGKPLRPLSRLLATELLAKHQYQSDDQAAMALPPDSPRR